MTLTFEAVDGIGEISAGDDLAEIITRTTRLQDGDVVVVTSKIVSKAAGLTTTRDRAELLAAETDRVVARRGGTSIVRTRHGLTMASAGIDESNTPPGTRLPLPPDPDRSASEIRARIAELTGTTVAVVVSDTAGRAWRIGQTDIAIGCAGLEPVESFAGRSDTYGNPLAATSPAIADQVAAGAELASGKLGGRPVVVVRGTDPAWHTELDGPGARALVRDEHSDWFGLGAREAAVAAILGAEPVRGLPADAATDVATLVDLAVEGLDIDRAYVQVDGTTVVITVADGALVSAGVLAQRLVSLGVAHGLRVGIRITSA